MRPEEGESAGQLLQESDAEREGMVQDYERWLAKLGIHLNEEDEEAREGEPGEELFSPEEELEPEGEAPWDELSTEEASSVSSVDTEVEELMLDLPDAPTHRPAPPRGEERRSDPPAAAEAPTPAPAPVPVPAVSDSSSSQPQQSQPQPPPKQQPLWERLEERLDAVNSAQHLGSEERLLQSAYIADEAFCSARDSMEAGRLGAAAKLLIVANRACPRGKDRAAAKIRLLALEVNRRHLQGRAEAAAAAAAVPVEVRLAAQQEAQLRQGLASLPPPPAVPAQGGGRDELQPAEPPAGAPTASGAAPAAADTEQRGASGRDSDSAADRAAAGEAAAPPPSLDQLVDALAKSVHMDTADGPGSWVDQPPAGAGAEPPQWLPGLRRPPPPAHLQP